MNECMNKSDRLRILSPYADKFYDIVTVAANGGIPYEDLQAWATDMVEIIEPQLTGKKPNPNPLTSPTPSDAKQ
jgi:hypothetical protein